MATDVRWYVNVAEQTLRRVADHLPDRSLNGDYNASLSAALRDLPSGVVVAVYDEMGKSLAFLGQTRSPVDVSDRHYFQALRDGEEMVVSNLISDRVTGTMTFAVGIPVLDAQGDFAGAAVAYAPMAAFEESWLKVGGESSNAFIVHKEGWITARLPAIDSAVYDTHVSSEFADRFFETDRGSYWAPESPIDGIVRVLGFAQVPNTPLAAVVGINPDLAMGRFWGRVFLIGAIMAPVLALLGVVAWRGRELIKRQEETALALAQSNARNADLLMEIHHRIKNNLQSALALVRIHVKDRQTIAEIEPRIHAMVAAHEHIYRQEKYDDISARTYISELARKTIYASSSDIELQTEIEDIALSSEALMPIGQLVNEAVINAIKYGFPDGRAGVIRITLTTDAHGVATLTVYDNGNPLPESALKGTGSRLMRAFAGQLHGEVQTISDADGVSVVLTFPLRRP